MAGELVSAATILAGSGAATWFADKLLGPSVEGLGEQIKVFAGDRLRKILGRASEQAESEELKQLPPGFVYQFVQRASLSEDNQQITEMWAQLLLAASKNYKSRYSLYVDVLSQLGPSEVKLLDDMVAKNFVTKAEYKPPLNLRDSIRTLAESGYNGSLPSGNLAAAEIGRILGTPLQWPGKLIFATVPWREPDGPPLWAVGGSSLSIEHEVLIRQQLIERFSFSFKNIMPAPTVEGVLVTSLGLEFVMICRGANK